MSINPTAGHAAFFPGTSFTTGFTPPDYLIDRILQRGYFYGLTAPTGHGKTTIALKMAFCISHGHPFGGHPVHPGKVLFLAGENPDDIRARVIVGADAYGLPVKDNLIFSPGSFNIETEFQTIAEQVESIGGVDLIIVDTLAAYFMGEDENSNGDMLVYARLLRRLTTVAGHPAVMVCCHPVKNAKSDALLPRGGGSFIAELDGNLTLWSGNRKDGAILELHHNKLRGPCFDPLYFELKEVKTKCSIASEKIEIPSVIAEEITWTGEHLKNPDRRDQEHLLIAMSQNSGAPSRRLAELLSWETPETRKPDHAKVVRLQKKLQARDLASKEPGRSPYVLSTEGLAEAQRLRSDPA